MSKNPSDISRRRFVSTAALAAAPMIVPSSVLGQRAGAFAPSDRIVMAGLAIGNRGSGDLRNFMTYDDVVFVAICDVRESQRETIKTAIDEKYGNNDCQMYDDQHELLARQDLDAVLIAAGERWHTLLAIEAVKAGKDVYCEKPCGSTIEQDVALRETIRRYPQVYQAGCQRRHAPNFVFAVDLAHSGKLGILRTVKAQCIGAQSPVPTYDWLPAEEEPPREVVWWDRWLGPAPWRPYNSYYLGGGRSWAEWFDFHGGSILEWGSHTVDLCQWAAGCDHTSAITYEPDAQDSQDDPFNVYCRYANGVQLVIGRGPEWLGLGSCSVRFEGDDGWVEVGDGNGIAVSDNLKGELPPSFAQNDPTWLHIRNMLDCVKTRSEPKAGATSTANEHITAHAALISVQLGRKLEWDPEKLEFVNDDEANRMRSRAMRAPWRL